MEKFFICVGSNCIGSLSNNYKPLDFSNDDNKILIKKELKQRKITKIS